MCTEEYDDSGRPICTIYVGKLSGVVFVRPVGITADDENYLLCEQDIVRQIFHAQNPAELTIRRDHEVGLIA